MKSPSNYAIASLDGLRGLAIILVVWCHLTAYGADQGMNVGPAPLHAVGDFGLAGVFLFFILSGFLLFLPYARAILAASPWPSVRTFYQRRALRILPAYYLVLVVFTASHGGDALRPTHLAAFSLLPVLLQDWWRPAFDLSSQLDGPFWTLTVEWQFYLLLPWMALGLARLAGKGTTRSVALRLALGLGLLVLVGLSLRLVTALFYYQSGGTQPYDAAGLFGLFMKLVYGAKGRYLEVFALGIGASLLYVWGIEQGRLARWRGQMFGSLAVAVAVAGLAASVGWALQAQRIPPNTKDPMNGLFVPPTGWAWQIFGEWVSGCCFALLLLGVLLGAPWLRQVFESKPLRFMGKISYSLYLWHFPLLLILATVAPTSVSGAYLRFVVSGVLIIVLVSLASYYGIERPFLRWRRATPLAWKPITLEGKR